MNTDMIVAELKAEVKRLEHAIAALESVGASSGAGSTGAAPRRKISAAGRRRIALAQKARRAKVRSEKAKSSRK